jgi:endonuclease G
MNQTQKTADNNNRIIWVVGVLILILLILVGVTVLLYFQRSRAYTCSTTRLVASHGKVEQTSGTPPSQEPAPVPPANRKYYYAGQPISREPLLVLTNIGYVVGYDDNQRHDPKWVCYRLFAVNNLKAPPRPQGFSVDGRTRSRIASADYAGYYNGLRYDRGHCAPNYAIALCYGPEAQRETFLMSNVLPELPPLNQRVWERLEQREIKEYALRFEQIWITTGPVFGMKDKHLRHDIDVPEACYKIMADEDNGHVRVLAFVIPQTVTGNEDAARFLTSVDEVEKKTGLDFFSELPDDVENRVEAEVASGMW